MDWRGLGKLAENGRRMLRKKRPRMTHPDDWSPFCGGPALFDNHGDNDAWLDKQLEPVGVGDPILLLIDDWPLTVRVGDVILGDGIL